MGDTCGPVLSGSVVIPSAPRRTLCGSKDAKTDGACGTYGRRGAYRALEGKSEEKILLGRPRLRSEDIKRVIRREGFEWINLTQDYGQVAGSF
jgi:hypothetical protein